MISFLPIGHAQYSNKNTNTTGQQISPDFKKKKVLGFEANYGQHLGDEYFRLKGKEMDIIFRQGAISFYVAKMDKDSLINGHHWKMNLSDQSLIPTGQGLRPTQLTYLKGEQAINAAFFKKISYKSPDGSQELVFYFNDKGQLEYDFILAAGVDPNQCFYTIEGLAQMTIAPNGDLELPTSIGQYHYSAPFTYQVDQNKQQIIASNYVVKDNKIAFEVDKAAIDPNLPLIIDPVVMEWATYLGTDGYDYAQSSTLDEFGNLLAAGNVQNGTTVTGFATTGAYQTTSSDNRDAFIAKFAPDGTALAITLFGGDAYDNVSGIEYANGKVVITGSSSSSDFPYTADAEYTAADNCGQSNTRFIAVLDNTLSNLIYSSSTLGFYTYNMDTDDNGNIYLGGVSYSCFTTTPESPLAFEDGMSNLTFIKFNNSTYQTEFISVIGHADDFDAERDMIQVKNNKILVAGVAEGSLYTAPTANAFRQTPPADEEGGVIGVFNLDGSADFLSYWGNDIYDGIYDYYPNFSIDDLGNAYMIHTMYENADMIGTSPNPSFPNRSICVHGTYLLRVNNDGSFAYQTYLGCGEPKEGSLREDLEGDYIYLANASDFPITLGRNYGTPTNEGYHKFLKINISNGAVEYVVNLEDASVNDLEVIGNSVFMSVYYSDPSLKGLFTADAFWAGSNVVRNNALLAFDADDGQLRYGTAVLGLSYTQSNIIPENENEIYYVTYIPSNNTSTREVFVSTGAHQTANAGLNEVYIARFDLCPDFNVVSDDITPATQESCQYGYPDILNASKIQSEQADTLAFLGTNGLYYHPPQVAKYQWQESENANGPWVNLPTGITEDFLPSVGNTTKYYRRLALNNTCSDTISISATAVINVNNLVAPEVDAGGQIFTCPNVPVILGGSPTATTANGNLTYNWYPTQFLNDPTLANPTATVDQTTVFTVEVTDDLNCRSISQVVVSTIVADPDEDEVTYCQGSSGRAIGMNPFTGVPGITYTWTPNDGTLSDPTIARPLANPSTTTTYTLTVTIDTQDGGTCSTSADVLVNSIANPTADAGPDVTVCIGNPTQIGLAAEPNIQYYWTPGLQLNDNQSAQPTFDALMPNPPISRTYTLTEREGECVDYDQVDVFVIQMSAGVDGCGPRFIGSSDISNGAYTYSWTVVSGDAQSIVGQENIPRPYVDPTEPTTYQLEVSLNGVTCTDQVYVPVCGCPPTGTGITLPIDCETEMPIIPAQLGLSNVNTTHFDYEWVGPTEYLDNPNIINPFIITNPPNALNFTINVTRKSTGAIECTGSVIVYPALGGKPVPEAYGGTLCPTDPGINIGAPTVAGYTYQWSPEDGLDNPNISNPVADPDLTTTYTVVVTDTQSGCTDSASAIVERTTVQGGAGNDWAVCSNAIIELGTGNIDNGNYSYNWSPVNSNWQNGTDNTSATPVALVAITTEFHVTITDLTSNCTKLDTALVVVESSPTAPVIPSESICEGDDVQLELPVYPDVIYSWTGAGLSCYDCPDPIASPTSTTTYTYTLNYPGNCTNPPMGSVTITVNDPSFDLGDDLTFCPSNGPINIGDNAPSGMSSYNWTPNVDLSSNNIQNPASSSTSSITYTLTAVDGNGCEASDDISLVPSAMPNAGSDVEVCPDEVTVLGAPSNPATASWSPAQGLSCTTCAMPSFSDDVPGTYTFTVEITENGCTNTDEVIVTVKDFVAPEVSGATICQDACGVIGTTDVPGNTYAWSPNTVASPNAAMTEVCPTMNTNYQLAIQDAATGCIAIVDVPVFVETTPAPDVMMNDFEVCAGTTIMPNPQITPPSSNYTYEWTPNTYISDPYIANPDLFPPSTQTYTLSVIDNATGCIGISSTTITIFVDNGDLMVDMTAPASICSQEQIILTGTVTGTYSNTPIWTTSGDGTFSPSNTATDPTYTPGTSDIAAGTVSISYSAEGVCGNEMASQEVTITTCAVYDWGDLPESTYATTIANNGPRHQIIAGLNLGNQVDEDGNGQQTTDADGDDNDGIDDEDGIIFASVNATINGSLTFNVTAENTTGEVAYLEAWIDWNGDGDFDDPNEMIIAVSDAGGNFPSSFTIPVPSDAIANQDIGVRFRLSNTDNMTPYGSVDSGEVEDYLIMLDASCGTPPCLPLLIVPSGN